MERRTDRGPASVGGGVPKPQPAPQPKPAPQPELGPQPEPALQPAAVPGGSVDIGEEAWFAGLKQSRLDWDVPAKMAVGATELVTVRIHGYADAADGTDGLPGKTGAARLKVATQMTADLVSASGEDIQVIPAESEGTKYVPATGSNDWSWEVTPMHSERAATLKLTVRAVRDASHSRSFVTYSRPFAIQVVTGNGIVDWMQGHFWPVMKYWAPGGAGFLALTGVVQWWRKRRVHGRMAVEVGADHAGD